MLVFKPNLLEEVDRIVEKRLRELVNRPLRRENKELLGPGPSGPGDHGEPVRDPLYRMMRVRGPKRWAKRQGEKR